MPELPVGYGEVGATIHEESETVKNLLGIFEKLYYYAGAITRPSKFAKSEHNPQGKERPLFLRHERAHIVKGIRSKRTEFFKTKHATDALEGSEWEKAKLLKQKNEEALQDIAPLRIEARLRDLLAEQYLNQRTISINLPELGVQQARTIDLCLPDAFRTRKLKALPPIFFIPGASNDIECVGALAVEMALAGRRVIVVAYPESFNGHATKEFAEAAKTDASYGPHVAFFKAALDHFTSAHKQIELWGFSTGSPITASILQEPSYQKKTTNAVLICPASSVNQSVKDVERGGRSELAAFKDFGSTANFVFSTGTKNEPNQEQLARRGDIFQSLLQRVARTYTHWPSTHVRDGGRITILSGSRDKITKSSQAKELFAKNEQMHFIELPHGFHMTPLIDPKTAVTKIFDEQSNSSKQS